MKPSPDIATLAVQIVETVTDAVATAVTDPEPLETLPPADFAPEVAPPHLMRAARESSRPRKGGALKGGSGRVGNRTAEKPDGAVRKTAKSRQNKKKS
jgi:hypothetical protein